MMSRTFFCYYNSFLFPSINPTYPEGGEEGGGRVHVKENKITEEIMSLAGIPLSGMTLSEYLKNENRYFGYTLK